jgi:hypothetical protein
MSAIRSQITDTEIAGGVGLVKIRNQPRDRKYAEASTIFNFEENEPFEESDERVVK